jgi:hypothetical protein
MDIVKSKKTFPCQQFNGKNYYQYEGRYFTRHIYKMHRDVWEFYNGKIPKGYHIHHIDGNPSNNDISNLQLMQGKDHLRMEGKKRHKENPEWSKKFHQKGIELAKEWHKSKEGIEWHIEHGRKVFANRIARTLNCQVCNKSYQTKNYTNSRFCSNNCKSAYRRASGLDNEKRICIICNSEFECNKYIKKSKCNSNCGK